MTRTPTEPESQWDDGDVGRVLAVVFGVLVLAGPSRTRPLAGFLYGVFLSRVHGAGIRRLELAAYRAARGGGELHRAHALRLDRLESRAGLARRSPGFEEVVQARDQTDAWLRQVEEAERCTR